MSLFGGLRDGFGNWALSIMLKRVIAALVGWMIGFLTGAKIAALLTSWGVTIDPVTFQNTLEAILTAGSVALHDWLRMHKWFKDI